MTERRLISSGSKWEPVLGYSRAVKAGNAIYVSGTVGVAPDGSVPEGVYDQARCALDIICKALADAGSRPEDVVRTRVFMTDVGQFDELARAHGERFGAIRPATTVVEVRALVAPEFLVEIEAVAVV